MNAQTIQTLGAALLHFLWQGALLGVLLFLAVSLTREAKLRYGLAVGALAAMALCPVATFVILTTSDHAAALVPLAEAPAVNILNVTTALNPPTRLASLDWLTCLVWIWSAGVFLFALRAFGGWLVLQRLKRTAQEALSPDLFARCRRLQQRIAANTFVRFAHSEMVDAPAVVGWFRPVVLIPLSALAGLSVEQLDAIVAHELAHIKRYDGLVNLFQIAVETLLFYHPAIWWVNRLIRAERENCCDDIAVGVCGDAHQYARALAILTAAQAKPAWAMAANGGALKARVSRLLGIQKLAQGVPRGGLAILALLCVSGVVLAAGAFKQDAPPPPPPPPPPAAAPLPSTPPAPAIAAAQTRPPLPPKPPEPPHESAEPNPPSYIDSLASVGLTKLTVEELISLKIQGVTADYVRQIKAAGLDPSVRELIGLKVQGVTPEFVRALQSAGLGELRAHDFIAAKIQGVTPEFIEKVRSHGFKDLTLRQLIGLKMANVF